MRYLQDYAEQLQLKIQYETEIKEVDKGPDEEGADSCFHLKDQNGVVYRCDILIVRYKSKFARKMHQNHLGHLQWGAYIGGKTDVYTA